MKNEKPMYLYWLPLIGFWLAGAAPIGINGAYLNHFTTVVVCTISGMMAVALAWDER